MARNIVDCRPKTLFATGSDDDEIAKGPLAELNTPFVSYCTEVRAAVPGSLAQLLLFENYRFGLSTRKVNTHVIELDGVMREFKEALVTVGRDEGNLLRLKDSSVNRWHCVLVNYFGDVWVYDVGSKFGVVVDGTLVKRKAYLDGVHAFTIGNTDLRISSRAGLLV
jgi:FHA domain